MMASHIPTATATTNRSTGAMALLEKYATLNKCIESTRNQTTHAQSELDSTQQSIQTLKKQSNEMNQDIVQINSDTQTLLKNLKEATRKLSSVDRVQMECMQMRDSVQRELNLVNQMRKDGRSEFLDKCKEFRTICKSIKIALSSMDTIPRDNASGRHDAMVLAHFGCGHNVFLSSDDDDAGENSISDEHSVDKDTCHGVVANDGYKSRTRRQVMEDETSSSTSTLSASVTCPWSGENYIKEKVSSYDGEVIPTKRRRHKQHDLSNKLRKTASSTKKRAVDDEMNQAKLDNRESTQVMNEARRVLEGTKCDRRLAIHRANDREKKLSQQMLQLERVREDAREIEKELEELENNTNEARQMGNTFATDASRRKKIDNRHGSTTSTASNQNGTSYSQYGSQYGFASNHQYTPTPPPPQKAVAAISYHESDESQRRYSITPSPYVSRHESRNETRRQPNDMHAQHHPIESFKDKHTYSSSKNRMAPKNPYKKHSKSSLRRDTNGLDHGQSSALPQTFGKSTLERQHPHRAGRIRVDKQFSTAISIMSESQTHSDCEHDEVSASRYESSRLGVSNNYLESANLSCEQTSGEKTISEHHIPSPTYLTIGSLDDSEDDDDELLNFDPFPKMS